MAMTSGVAAGAMAPERTGPDRLTVGVEEEFLLVDPHTGAAVPAIDLVMAQVPAELRGQVEREFQTSQIEIGSPPGLELSSIRHSLGVLRGALADAAERAGVRLLAIGTGPVAGPVPPVVDKPRFDRMIDGSGCWCPAPATTACTCTWGPGPGHRGAGAQPHPALAAGAARDDHQLPVLRGRRHRLRELAVGASGSAGRRWRPPRTWSRTSTTSG